jgi:hypothetical protein
MAVWDHLVGRHGGKVVKKIHAKQALKDSITHGTVPTNQFEIRYTLNPKAHQNKNRMIHAYDNWWLTAPIVNRMSGVVHR